ncbi:MAG: hypothetical protein ABFQ65_00570 [Nanoarchaeota archaeon]
MKRIKKENKEKIIEMIEKAGSEEYETSWNKAGVFSTSKKKSNVKKGKRIKGQASRFELKVRRDLENKGRIIDKWNNNVDLSPRDDSGEPEYGKLIIAKKKFNPFSKAMMLGAGFPDFISIKHIHEESYSVIGVEVKMNGILSKIEKEKCAWYLKNNIFSKIWIAKKGGTPKSVPRDISKEMSTKGKRGGIEYIDFKEKYGSKFL